MADIDKLRTEYEQAEAKAHALQASKDEAMQKVLDKYRDKMRDANAKLADAQKAFCDAEAVEALKDRPDGAAVAEALGLTLD